ncbi:MULTISPECIES: ABATE domain-containing protein [unclassified Streptomyces]|uniref:CGNR zinc finger domain-containing protein n=1 Tax=unclassified Streptomyces TaxID=2593676 RepID=UPI002254171A|nr:MULTISPECIES: ABATE domain-containing protein [unclassified Streptomyces]MCX4526100.1 ABATE domain-containing protein [Streptomyces sp. NBC_01551]MCX4543335.1 ABATE domain-containing protein [Streptomyces sp. NBC_01565]
MWFDSGRVCLDLVATSAPHEGIRDTDELRLWLTGAGLVPDRTPLARMGPDWVDAFRALRHDVETLVRAELDAGAPSPGTAAALARVNGPAAGPPPGLCAVRDQQGHLVRELCGGVECAGLLAAVARDAVELLTDPGDRALLRACEGDGCARVYLDTSRGHRRRWCSSELCGNRERVARHRRRVLAAGSA